MKPKQFIKENPEIGIHAQEMHDERQHEMLREECYHLAINSVAIHRMLGQLRDSLDPWAAEYISIANEHIKSVKEFLEGQQHEKGDLSAMAAVLEDRYDDKEPESKGVWNPKIGMRIDRSKPGVTVARMSNREPRARDKGAEREHHLDNLFKDKKPGPGRSLSALRAKTPGHFGYDSDNAAYSHPDLFGEERGVAEAANAAQQAAIAVNMKKQGKRPKNKSMRENVEYYKNKGYSAAKIAWRINESIDTVNAVLNELHAKVAMRKPNMAHSAPAKRKPANFVADMHQMKESLRAKIRENATGGATGAASVGTVVSELGGPPTNIIRRQQNYTNQRTPGGPVKLRKAK